MEQDEVDRIEDMTIEELQQEWRDQIERCKEATNPYKVRHRFAWARLFRIEKRIRKLDKSQ